MANTKTGFCTLATVLGLSLHVAAFGQASEVRVALPQVPGAAQLERGMIKEGIARLEREMGFAHHNKVGIVTALCAGYILSNDLKKAEGACDAAVREPTMRVFAHNNRGVLRLLKGDYDGAQSDFRRARATNLRSYVEKRQQRAISEIVDVNRISNERLAAADPKPAVQVVANAD